MKINKNRRSAEKTELLLKGNARASLIIRKNEDKRAIISAKVANRADQVDKAPLWVQLNDLGYKETRARASSKSGERLGLGGEGLTFDENAVKVPLI